MLSWETLGGYLLSPVRKGDDVRESAIVASGSCVNATRKLCVFYSPDGSDGVGGKLNTNNSLESLLN